ncbi:MAG: hypothetical protein LBT32_09160 [Peptococcaceae bacterium]|nr:hypothetical protein [Peptococcaceae bacterium]
MDEQNPLLNLQLFSAYIAKNWNIAADLLANHIFAVISLGLAVKPALQEDLSALYAADIPRFYALGFTCPAARHALLHRGRLEDEVYARKILALICAAETDAYLRSRLIRLLRRAFNSAYLAASQSDIKHLLKSYASEKVFCESATALTDRAVYFYVSLYCSPNSVDYQLITAVAHTMIAYEKDLAKEPPPAWLTDEYQAAKEFYYQNSGEALTSRILELEQALSAKEQEHTLVAAERDTLRRRNAESLQRLERIVDEQAKKFAYELARRQTEISKLNTEIAEENQYHQELFRLREYLLQEKQPSEDERPVVSLSGLIQDKSIVIFGGAKPWRRKLREKYPEIITLNGFNQNYEPSFLQTADCILFFTNALSHAVYNKAMNYIRTKHLPFGYISRTNLDFVERDIYEALKNTGI